MQSFGPTTAIVSRFFEAVGRLTPQMWCEAGERWVALEPPQYGKADRMATSLVEELRRNGVWVAAGAHLEELLARQRQLVRDSDPDRLLPMKLGHNAAHCALVALLVCDRAPAEMIEVLYCPFERLVPLHTLDPAGEAYGILPGPGMALRPRTGVARG